ncbi:vsp protein (plasmid) [Borrelia duttonii Ly]|uniref:Vsp protein n=2 Tax=Borrelia duttonii TaxID=40834 RepID=B5RP90_BORDL|nr:vsp protein [Borrelia duttonii Ly]
MKIEGVEGEIKGKRGKERVKRMDKRGNRMRIKGIILMIMIVMGCNSGGVKEGAENGTGENKNGNKGIVTRKDGTVLDLVKISQKIKEVSDFVVGVTEVDALVKSIDNLVAALGKKISAQGTADIANKNASLVVGAYNIIASVETKLTVLEQIVGAISTDLKAKVADAKTKSTAFLTKVKQSSADIGKDDTSAADAQKALKRDNNDKQKGADELDKLYLAIVDLVKAANNLLEATINDLVQTS